MLLHKLRSRDLIGRRRRRADQGFTLVELLVVITILGILAAVVIAAVSGIGDKGEDSARSTDLSIQQTAQEASCAKDGVYRDSLLLQDRGFLGNQSEYNDVAIDKLANTENCEGALVETFVPAKTTYPVTVTGCQGKATTFGVKPAKPYVLTPEMHELFFWLGIDENAKMGRVSAPYSWPEQFRDDIIRNLGRNNSRIADALSWPAGTPAASIVNQIPDSAFKVDAGSGTLPSRHITLQSYLVAPARDIDFVAGSGVNQFTTTALSPTFGEFVSDYTEDSLIAAYATANPGRELKTYNGFSVGGCRAKMDTKLKSGAIVEDANIERAVERESLEGTFRDIQNLGIIFDVQERAAEVISTMKRSIADSIARAKPGAGMRIQQTDIFRIQFGGADGTGTYRAYGSNHGFNGFANMLGATNPFGSLFPAGGVGTVSSTAFLAERPDILTIVSTLGPGAGITGPAATGYGPTQCDAAKRALRASFNSATGAWRGIPAIENDRIVCAAHDQGFLQGVSSMDYAARVATVMAAGPTGKGPCAAVAGTIPATAVENGVTINCLP
ncbi:MAG: prepilin-type N-terminal cleavage/methylation domain-containing protein [Sporichthyaceae bacterium]